MPDDLLTRKEHEEFARRIEDNIVQVNSRIDRIERQNSQITDLLVLVNKLANSMEHMMKEQEEQGQKIDKLESRDGELWRKFLGYIISGIVGIVLTMVLTNNVP